MHRQTLSFSAFLVFLCCVLAGIPAAICHAQTVDSSFQPSVGLADVGGIYLGPDGMYYVTGDMATPDGNRQIVRILRNGQLDSGFDVRPNGPVHGVGFIGDKIVIAGKFDQVNGVPRGRIARLDHDGSVDLAFELPQVDVPFWEITKIQVQPDGSVYAESEDFDGIVRRLTTTGRLDSGFNLNGVVHGWSPRDWIVRSTGELLWFGTYRAQIGDPWSQPVSLFSSSGTRIRTWTKPDDVSRIIPRGGDRLLGIGYFPEAPGSNFQALVAKFSADLGQDWSFVVSDLRYASLYDARELADGRVLFLGEYRWVDEAQSTISKRLGRVHTSGARDLTWDEVIFTPKPSMLRTILVEPDGTTLVGGNFTHVNGANRPGIVRIFVDDVQVPDPVFADGFDG